MENWLAQYGGLGLFVLLIFGIVGLPVPDETLLVFCGYLVYRGTLNPIATWLGGALGSMTGITFSYIIGRTLGLGFLHSRFGKWLHISDERLHKVHDWFGRLGHWALFVGYYIPGVRHFTAIIAGTSCLEFPAFALYAWSGACVWVTSFLFIGYHFGEDWERVFHLVHRNLTAVALTAAVIAAGYFLLRRLEARRKRANKSNNGGGGA